MKTKRQSRLRERSRGLPFGQRGSLIGSIKRVLDQYPHRSDVFKGARPLFLPSRRSTPQFLAFISLDVVA